MPQDPGFDERQARVAEALDGRSPKLACMYRAALAALAGSVALDDETSRISIICHCMREVMIGLPSVMTDSSSPRPTPSSGSLTSKLPGLLAQHPDLDLAVDQALVPVPKAVAEAISNLIGTVASEQGRNRRNAAELVTGGADTMHPAIKQWSDAYRFFVGWAHIDRNHSTTREMPTDEGLRSMVRVVEDVIEVRSALFFDNVHSLQDLLAEANALTQEVGDE